MVRRAVLIALLVCCGAVHAAEVVDATGRTVQVPDQVTRVLPAGPPAAVLLAAVAPDLMLGWPSAVAKPVRTLLSPQVAALPQVPRLTGRDDVTGDIRNLSPDLIIDYGTLGPRYVELATQTQQRTGIPTLLFSGALDDIPRVLRTLGMILHRQERAETLAATAEVMLTRSAITGGHPRVVYARGTDGASVAAPDTNATDVFTYLGWQVVAPGGDGPFRPATIDAIAGLDPDILIFAEPAMRTAVMHKDAWRAVRAVREKRVFFAPAMPFGWLEEPPSINRLLGIAWLGRHEPELLATVFNAVFYGHALTPAELGTVLADTSLLHP